MSHTYDTPGGVRLGTFVGPAAEGGSRQRWQLETNGLVVLRREEVWELVQALMRSLGDAEARGELAWHRGGEHG